MVCTSGILTAAQSILLIAEYLPKTQWHKIIDSNMRRLSLSLYNHMRTCQQRGCVTKISVSNVTANELDDQLD